MKKLIISSILFLLSLQGFAHKYMSDSTVYKRMPPYITLLKEMKSNYVKLITHEHKVDSKPDFTLFRPNVHKYGNDSVRINWQRWIDTIDTSMIQSYLDSLTQDGSFSDINYSPVSVGDWEGCKHVDRILSLAIYYHKCNNSDTTQLKLSINKAYKNWFDNDYKSGQWWTDTIYVPRILGRAALVFENSLQTLERDRVINSLGWPKPGGEGQQRIWRADIMLMKSLLQSNVSELNTIRDSIISVLQVNDTTDGIQPDWCFHENGHIQEFGNHGIIFIEDIAMLLLIFEVPHYKMPEHQYHIFDSLISEGYRYVLWHGLMDVPSIGRTVTKDRQRLGALYTGQVAKRMYNFTDSLCHNTGKRILRENFVRPDSIQPFVGHKHFFRSDYTIHRTPKWMTSVKMASNRVVGTELVSGSNKYGYYQGDGATYTQVNGNEYLYIYPLWDWRKIPGITCYNTTDSMRTDWADNARNNSSLVGGLTVGNGGISAMELNRDSLKAHKMWIFTDSLMLCLGYVFASPGAKATSIEQCMQQGNLLHLYNATSDSIITDTCTFNCDTPQLFYHNSIGYVSWDSVVVSAKQRTGSWGDFMSIYSKSDVDTGNVVSLYITHPADIASTYQYMLLPVIPKDEVKNFDTSRINVLRNDTAMQAVMIDDKLYIAAFAETNITVNGRKYVISTPGVYFFKDEASQPFSSMRE